MDKPINEVTPVPPDVDKQIQYIKHLRKEVLPRIKNLQTELDMITAIEQSLIAAKILEKSGEDAEFKNPSILSSSQANQILIESKIKVTAVRVEVLKAIFSKKDNEFTVAGIHKTISKYRPISKSAVITTMLLFKEKAIIEERKEQLDSQKRIGRPEAKFTYNKMKGKGAASQ
jgi:hypothetical protein